MEDETQKPAAYPVPGVNLIKIDQETLVNPEHIVSVRVLGVGASVCLSDGSSVLVREEAFNKAFPKNYDGTDGDNTPFIIRLKHVLEHR